MIERDILGIDFGTTNSKMAYMLLDDPVVIENREGKTITPSIVHFKGEEEYVVGELAKRNQVLSPDKVVSSIKREMGTDYKKKVGRHRFPPEYIGALIFKKLIDDAELRLGKKFVDAVVSVPANYSDSQRQAIRDSAEIAGINVLRLINEPTAAALSYGIREDRDRKLLVYDFGGGTFDVSVLTVASGFFDVDASTGEHRLGGDDIDARIVEHITKKLQKQLGVDPKNDLALLATLNEAAEEAKITLSTAESTTINIPFVAAGKPPFSMELTREQFNDLIADLIVRTRGPIEQALEDAALEKEDIDDILLVGGTTLIPAVREFVTRYFGKEPLTGDPYTAVALGAAIAGTEYGKERSRTAKNVEISDVVSCSMGVQVADGTLSKVIERNTKVPIARTREYTNAGDFVDEVIIPVFQGEEEMARENEFLGDFWISIEPLPYGQNRIEVTFEVGKEFGILNVTAIDKDSGNRRTVKMESRSRLSKKDKNKWMKSLMGSESVHVDIKSTSGKVTLDMFLNPTGTVSDLKRELREKGLIGETDTIAFNDMVPEDSQRIAGLNLDDESVVVVRESDGE
ncbi:MAG: Hsp70 family protein [Methanoregula sp.]|jgi:molecular chaperone DnaK|nr:Hsp70 family protein [Methanoregula sp.]